MEKTSENFARDIILEYIFTHRQFTIPEIAQTVGMSMTTIAKYVAELQAQQLLKPLEYVSSGKKGRRPMLYKLRSDSYFFLGVDIKSFELNIGLMNLAGEMVETKQIAEFRLDNTYGKIEEICQDIKDFAANSCGGGEIYRRSKYQYRRAR